MHTWGGALITATWHVLRPLPHRATSWLRKSESLLVLSVAMTVWEVVRYFWLTNLAPQYLFDTTTDTLAGLCGGLVIFLWYRSRTMD
jgi:hypothetical protein